MRNDLLLLRGVERDPRRLENEKRETAGPIRLSHRRSRSGLLRLLLFQAAAVGVVVVSIVLDSLLRPPSGVEVAWQFAAFFAALVLSWQGLARFVPDLDRRWTIRRKR